MKSDLQLQQDILAELQWEPSINAAVIGVEVTDGIVTLTGQVDTYMEKWEAERAAQRVSGVHALAVDIEIRVPGATLRNDADIARAADETLRWTTYVPAGAVSIVVENGWLTLSGEVGWEYQRRAAVEAVRVLAGVTGVSEEISIKRTVSSGAVKSEIEAALLRRSHGNGQHIFVDVNGSDVTLRGNVHSLAERELVTNCAWGSAGVRSVVDALTVSA